METKKIKYNTIIPSVSPRVVILRESTSGRFDGLDNIMARCGLQSPHFLSATHYK